MQNDRYTNVQSRTQSVDAGLRAHMVSVYNRMTVGVLMTAITAWLVSSSPALTQMLLGGPQAYIFMFAPIAIIWFGFNPTKMSSQKLMLAFGAVSVIYGISFSAIALTFAGADIAKAFFITAGMFAALSGFGYTTKKDLSALGTFCMMGMFGLILVSIVGMFVGFSSQVQMFISIGAVAIFAGLTAWETQSLKRNYNAANGEEINSRMAWAGALNLYISFIAMFMHILNLLQQR